MIRVFVDSGSSIKQNEKERYGVEILPLKILLGEEEYEDGIGLSMERFYHALIDQKIFPKTSLPSLGETEERVKAYLDVGDEVIIVTISSGISGTYHALCQLFSDESRVRVIDSKSAVGGIRLLVEEIHRHREESLDAIVARVKALIPRLRVIAIPDTLEYLHRGGRLSRSAWAIGSVMQLKPLISLNSHTGGVEVVGKVLGRKRAMQTLAGLLEEQKCDLNYGIVPSYTYEKENLDQLIAMTDPKYHAQMREYDNLDPAVACHWGPNAFGYIFVSQEE